MYENLSEYIARIEREGELVRVGARVDTLLEIAEITDRVAKSPGGGKALLFENTGTGFPVLTNMMGSDRRITLALGVESLDDIAVRLRGLFKNALSPKNGLGDKMKVLPLLGEMARWFPKTSRRKGECQQVILRGDDAKLSLLPVLKCWPHDGGRFITLPLVNTLDPDTGMRNVGMYRMQVTGERTTGMHWHLHKTGERHYRAYKRHGELMPVSVCIGGDPAYTYAATAPMPDNMDEYLLAGFLRRRPVKLVKCVTNDIYVPSDCDFVIEGYVDPAEDKFIEGPFGDHTGFYSLEDPYPVFHVTAITHRRDAVFPATLVGIPPQEDFYISKATEKIFLEPIRLALQPEITDLYMPAAGVAHNLALVSIEKSYAGQAAKVAGSMWGAGQMMFNKILIAASSLDDIRDADTIARLLRNADMNTDVILGRGVLDVLDHATATPGEGGKLALDLTNAQPDKMPHIPDGLEFPRWAESADISLTGKWGILILRVDRAVEHDAAGWLAASGIAGVNYLVLADPATQWLTHEELLWHAAGNTDPGRDITMRDGTMIIDARTKAPSVCDESRRQAAAACGGSPHSRSSCIPAPAVCRETPSKNEYPQRVPNIVASDPSTIALVDGRWDEYGIGTFLESPSSRFSKLIYNDKAQISDEKA